MGVAGRCVVWSGGREVEGSVRSGCSDEILLQ
jgi:hypothetical protein